MTGNDGSLSDICGDGQLLPESLVEEVLATDSIAKFNAMLNKFSLIFSFL